MNIHRLIVIFFASSLVHGFEFHYGYEHGSDLIEDILLAYDDESINIYNLEPISNIFEQAEQAQEQEPNFPTPAPRPKIKSTLKIHQPINKNKPKEIFKKSLSEIKAAEKSAFSALINPKFLNLGSPLVEGSVGYISSVKDEAKIPNTYRWNQRVNENIKYNSSSYILRQFTLRPRTRRTIRDPHIKIWTLQEITCNFLTYWTEDGLEDKKDAEDFLNGKLKKEFETKKNGLRTKNSD